MNLRDLLRATATLVALLSTAACSDGPTGPEPPPEPSFVRLESEVGDYIGQGRNYAYDHGNSLLVVRATGHHLDVTVSGDEAWDGHFYLPNSTPRIRTGTYEGLTRYPFHGPDGGMEWWGGDRGCNTLEGTVTVTAVEYAGDVLQAVDLTFEQQCDGDPARLRGTIHWRADEQAGDFRPVTPVPAGLWAPSAGVVPGGSRWVYLDSQAGDVIGGGTTHTYTGAQVDLAGVRGHMRIIAGDWEGHFQTMATLNELQPGYYGNLRRYPFHNPTRGGLSWAGYGRGCNAVTGWFVVDRVTYTQGRVTELDLRFEQHCEGVGPALRGAVHWTE